MKSVADPRLEPMPPTTFADAAENGMKNLMDARDAAQTEAAEEEEQEEKE